MVGIAEVVEPVGVGALLEAGAGFGSLEPSSTSSLLSLPRV